MLIRDDTGKIIIIFRKDCKNELFYNTKIYTIMSQYKEKFANSTFIVPPKSIININIKQNCNTNKKQKYNDESSDDCSDNDN